MTKPISSYPEAQRRSVIERRLKQRSGGSGYWAAVQAAEKLGIKKPSAGRYVGKKTMDRIQAQAGREFAKAFSDRKKKIPKRPGHVNKMRMA